MSIRFFAVSVLLACSVVPVFAEIEDRTYSNYPSGEGNPYVYTCRPPQILPGSRLRGPEVCKTNAVWAQYRKDGMDVAADGTHDVQSERWRSVNPQACRPATMGSGGTISASQTNFSLICE